MFIVSKDREIVVNVDNVTNIYIENGNKVIARMVDSEEIVLGFYVAGNAKEVFNEMLSNVFPPATLILKNCELDEESISAFKDKTDVCFVRDDTNISEVKMYDCGVYYMPEE